MAAFGLPSLASAASLEKGASLAAIELSRGVADLTGGGGSGTLVTFALPEVGIQGQYWYFLANEYAVNLSGGIGYFKESDTADPAALGAENFKRTLSSWKVRLGGDRFAKVSDKLQVFAGPGLQMWGGKVKDEYQFSGTAESPSTSRFAIDGRIGAHILIGQNFGLIGHVGQYWGYATASEGDAKTKWLPSGSEGAMGFTFAF
jgi:hypothetical protein